MTLMLAAPAAVALGILATPLIATLFLYGEFSPHDLEMTRQALVAYSIGLIGLILVKVLAPGFYARQNIKTPVKIAVITLIATQAMNLMFIGHLQHAGLALSIGLGACLNAGILFYKLRTLGIFRAQAGWFVFLLKLGMALSVMGALLWWGMGPARTWVGYDFAQRMAHLTALVFGGASAYFATLWLLGFRLHQFKRNTV
jgi:putative peptidoglycan lipid II flippase